MRKDILGCPGYQIDDTGNVWSSQTKGRKHSSAPRSTKWRILKPFMIGKIGKKVPAVDLGGNTYKISHLVLEAFIGPRPIAAVACHFPDRDVCNNSATNLMWGSQLDNKRHSMIHGTSAKGDRHGRSVLTEQNVLWIRERRGKIRLSDMAAILGVSRGAVQHAADKRNWKWIA